MKVNDNLKPKGELEVIIEHKDKPREIIEFPNTVLNLGRQALAASLANDIGDVYEFYIAQMSFGDGGTTGTGQPKVVNADRTGFFGSTILTKPVTSNVDPNLTSQSTFTSVIKFDEANGNIINELALVMANGSFYSMVTLTGINKDSTMQLTINWRLTFV